MNALYLLTLIMITWNVFLTYHVCLTQPDAFLLCISAMIIAIIYVVLVRSSIDTQRIQQLPIVVQSEQSPLTARHLQQQPSTVIHP